MRISKQTDKDFFYNVRRTEKKKKRKKECESTDKTYLSQNLNVDSRLISKVCDTLFLVLVI